MVIRNDQLSLSEIEKIGFDGIVISPGPGTPVNSGNLMKVIEQWYQKVPILGICLGHQALGQFFGAELYTTHYPMHGKVSSIELKNHPMWEDLPGTIEVCRYHSLAIKIKTTNPLIETALCPKDGVNMAWAHAALPIWGIQFHPEAILTQFGLEILNNWLKAFILHNQPTK